VELHVGLVLEEMMTIITKCYVDESDEDSDGHHGMVVVMCWIMI
jgi:hypothetical protein